MTKVHVKNYAHYFELSSKPNVNILDIIVSMWKHVFEIIVNSNGGMNIQYGIGKVFGYRERIYDMGMNAHFSPRQSNIPHATPYYGHGKS